MRHGSGRDNILYGHGLPDLVAPAVASSSGATVFAYQVTDPERYGVVEFDASGHTISIEEKPKAPKSNWAVIGLYVYDSDVVSIAKSLKPSARGELEITDLNVRYMERGKLKVVKMGRGFAWFDTGTPDSLLDASAYVATIEKRQGLKIASPDKIAYRLNYISQADLAQLIERRYPKNAYGGYLRQLIQSD